MDVCARLRGILGMRKIGHAGTLDPMAEGVLPVALGRATKDVDRIGDGKKTYIAGMLLGCVTDTQDITGTKCSKYTGELPSEEAVRNACLSFIGPYEQLTPMYSARKVAGKKLYEYARAGKEVERKRKLVEILDLRIEEINLPHVRLRVTCTKGTYIRTLCHDIGEKLGCGACMESLLRTRVGDFDLRTARKLSDVAALCAEHCLDEALVIKAPTAVALGKFDGTHVGHRTLFRTLLQTAQENHLRSCVLILDPTSKRIEDREERKAALYALGIDYCIELPLGKELMHMPAEAFLQEILLRQLNMKAIVAGRDVSFGYQKGGDAAFLNQAAKRCGFEVKLIDKVETVLPECSGSFPHASIHTSADERERELSRFPQEKAAHPVQAIVSSTRLREELSAGRMENVAALLGRSWALCGRVVHGRHLGGPVMGFPTMNIDVPPHILLPPFGVYAVRLTFLDQPKQTGRDAKRQFDLKKAAPESFAPSQYDGIANLGTKPTVTEAGEKPHVNLETYAFDFNGDAYGREIRVELLKFIRPERCFRDLEEIKEQLLGKDIAAVKAYLAARKNNEKTLA